MSRASLPTGGHTHRLSGDWKLNTQNLLREAALGPGGTAQPPQQASQSQNEFSLDGRLRIVVGSDGHLKRRIVLLGIFEGIDHGFCGQRVTDGILPGPPLAFLGDRPAAELSVAVVSLDFISPPGEELGSFRYFEAGRRRWNRFR